MSGFEYGVRIGAPILKWIVYWFGRGGQLRPVKAIKMRKWSEYSGASARRCDDEAAINENEDEAIVEVLTEDDVETNERATGDRLNERELRPFILYVRACSKRLESKVDRYRTTVSMLLVRCCSAKTECAGADSKEMRFLFGNWLLFFLFLFFVVSSVKGVG